MKKIAFMLLCVGLWAINAQAQSVRRWSVGVELVGNKIGEVSNLWHEGYKHRNSAEIKIVPSLSYNISPSLSAGVALQLPVTDRSLASMASAELFVRKSYTVLPRLSISLTAVGGVGTVGFYENVETTPAFDCGSSTNLPQYSFIRARYYAGLRPSVAYQIGERVAVSLGYGFLGYLSNGDVGTSLSGHYDWDALGDDVSSSFFGFSRHATYGNGLRLGLRLSL